MKILSVFLLCFLVTLLALPAHAAALQTNQPCVAVTATTTSTQILLYNPGRIGLVIQNNGTTGVWLQADSVQSGTTISLYIIPGGNYSPLPVPTNAFWIMSASGTDAVSVCEGS